MKNAAETAIIIFARKIRDIQANNIEPFEKMIHEQLGNLIPSLIEKDRDGIFDWTCDIINCSNDQEVAEIIERIKSIEHERVVEQWVCKYCNKNTYECDIENLFGRDHISCTLEHEGIKECCSTESVELQKLKSQLSRMNDYIVQLESRLAQVETQYEEPTN